MNSAWDDIFRRWPSDAPTRGILVTHFGEQIPFSDFRIGDGTLYVDRSVPDQLGGRSLIIPFEQIAAVKFVDVVKSRFLRSLGFEAAGTPAGGSASAVS